MTDYPVILVVCTGRVKLAATPSGKRPQSGGGKFRCRGGCQPILGQPCGFAGPYREPRITLRRPFYPYAPGGTRREHLHLWLGLAAPELRRRCEGTDAGTLFWTLGGKQVGKGALAGWQLLTAARHREPGIALWPFAGPLPRLLDGGGLIVVVETYPREYYQYIRPPGAQAPRWSKRRRADRPVSPRGRQSQSWTRSWSAFGSRRTRSAPVLLPKSDT
jgi:hypothetical protein